MAGDDRMPPLLDLADTNLSRASNSKIQKWDDRHLESGSVSCLALRRYSEIYMLTKIIRITCITKSLVTCLQHNN